MASGKSERRFAAWRVSLHGGHSGEFCDHADDTLEALLEAAVEAGMAVYGVTEHAPRLSGAYLYPEEVERGRSVASLAQTFGRYAERSRELQGRFAGRLAVLRGFETEVVPEDRYAEYMLRYREHYGFDYVVGSVHHVLGECIDGPRAWFAPAVAKCGGVEPLAIRYYEAVGAMIAALKPEVLGHFDLITKNAPGAETETPGVRRAAQAALELARAANCILDVNTAGYRKGLGRPYPAPWVVEMAREMGLGFCFGDDSHRVGEVGAGMEEAREYLLSLEVRVITVLERGASGLVRREVPLL
jgi:histidinol-phosphatase (PHP family)